MEEHLLMCYGDQHTLASALLKKDINAFRQALQSPSDVEKLPADESETPVSIFEQACQTPGCAEFIEECVAIGCDVNKLNDKFQKRPINFAVESLCFENVAALLADPHVNVDSKYSTLTPINFLAEKISDTTFSQVYRCIKLLFKHGADLNIPSRRGITPIVNILKNKNLSTPNKELIVTYFLENANVDIDTHRDGEARSLITKWLPDLDLPPVRVQLNQSWDFNRLMACLQNENEAEFLQGINFIAEHKPDELKTIFAAIDNSETLLILACKKGLSLAVERMLRLGADINAKTDGSYEPLSPIKCACIFGHWKVLEILIKSPKLDLSESGALISIVIKNIGERVTQKCNYSKCFEVLLNQKKIDLNQQDMFGCSPLHYAIKFNNSDVIRKLLEKGAFIGVRNKFNQLSISNINPKVLEKHLDSCITTNGIRTGQDTFEIHFDYTNLVPLATRDSCEKSTAAAKASPNEMTSIEYIAESNELRHLIRHPLIASFLFLKWNRLALIFYLNFLLCSLFAVSSISYILVCYNEEPQSVELKNMMRCVTLILTAYIAVRELSQFIFSPRIYLKSLENYLECVLVALMVMILFNICPDGWPRTVAATSILLIALEIFLLAGSLPFWSFSTHYVMLKTVTWSFLRSLSLYAIVLLAFALSFFTLLREPPKNTREAAAEDDGELNKFGNLPLSIIKTLVMSTGEFDAASIKFDLNPWSYVVFIAFLFIISTVLLNLLNGLAVNDTQVIKSEAELTNYIRRSEVLARYEMALLSHSTWFSLPPFMRYLAREKNSVFQELKPVFRVKILPNANNQILIPNQFDAEKDIDAKAIKCYDCFSCFGQCTRMDSKIVKSAFSVLDKVKMEEYEEEENNLLKERIARIEVNLENIANQLNSILKK